MPDIEHNLHYRGVDWKKVNKRQEEKYIDLPSIIKFLMEAPADLLTTRELVIVYLNVLIPPRRLKDYSHMKITTCNNLKLLT